MKVEILEFVDGARNAKGVAVIIDVFRAFSVACYAVDSGAVRIIATSEVSEAFHLKEKYKNSVLVGERDEKKIAGFDFGNSPTEILKLIFQVKLLSKPQLPEHRVLSTPLRQKQFSLASLVNAGAIMKYIKTINPDQVTLVAMGYRATISAEEDKLCAEMISNELKNKRPIPDKRISELQNTSGKRFFVPGNIDFSPPTDFFLCTMINKFDFVLKATRRFDGNVDLMRIDL